MDEYREGKVKSTPDRGVKETLKPCARKRSEPLFVVTACLLHNEPTSRSSAARVRALTPAPGARASPNRAFGVAGGGRETLRSTPGQAEGAVTGAGGPNRFTLKSARMSWG